MGMYGDVVDGYHGFFEKRKKNMKWRPATEEELEDIRQKEEQKQRIWNKAKEEAKRKPYYCNRSSVPTRKEGESMEERVIEEEVTVTEEQVVITEKQEEATKPGRKITKHRWEKADLLEFLRQWYEEKGKFPSGPELEERREAGETVPVQETLRKHLGRRKTWYDQVFAEKAELAEENEPEEKEPEIKTFQPKDWRDPENNVLTCFRNLTGTDIGICVDGKDVLIPAEGKIELTNIKSKVDIGLSESLKSAIAVYQEYERPMIVRKDGLIVEMPKACPNCWLILTKEMALMVKNFGRETRDILYPLNTYEEGKFYHIISLGKMR